MDAATAEARIKRMVAWDSDPALSQGDIEELVTLAARADADGLAPDDDDWTETYDLNAAAAEGWRWKMAKATARVSFGDGTQSVSRSDFVAHCAAMVAQYQRRIAVNVPMNRYDDPWVV